jgi:hypothetical protein
LWWLGAASSIKGSRLTVLNGAGGVNDIAIGLAAQGLSIYEARPARRDTVDAPARNRTWNLRIKSPLLCQLSYRGGWAGRS